MRGWAILAVVVLLAGCSSPEEQSEVVVPGGPPVCEGGPPVPTITLRREVATTGLQPNAIRDVGNGRFVIVESSSNSLSLWNDGWKPFAELGRSRNPYDVTRSGDQLWVTNYLAETISVIDAETGELIDELDAPELEDPSGIARIGDRVVVTNVDYTSPTDPYGDGSYVVFDAASRMPTDQLEAAAKNPLFARTFGDGDDSVFVTTSSGEFFLSGDGAGVNSPGAVEVWREEEGQIDRQSFGVPLVEDRRIGAPGRPLRAPDGTYYFASGTAPVLFALDSETGWLHGSDDPLVFGTATGDALHHADIDSRGVILVTSFNEDGLYLWDTTCDRLMRDEPIDLGVTSFLEGPHGIAVTRDSEDESEAIFIMNLSNTLGHIVMDWTR